jgi:hypothetical protein
LLLSDGPVNRIGLNGRNHGEYWLFKTAHFHVNLDRIPEVFAGTISARVARNTAVDLVPQLDPEKVVFVENLSAPAAPIASAPKIEVGTVEISKPRGG